VKEDIVLMLYEKLLHAQQQQKFKQPGELREKMEMLVDAK
jgi:hypothetical protein